MRRMHLGYKRITLLFIDPDCRVDKVFAIRLEMLAAAVVFRYDKRFLERGFGHRKCD